MFVPRNVPPGLFAGTLVLGLVACGGGSSSSIDPSNGTVDQATDAATPATLADGAPTTPGDTAGAEVQQTENAGEADASPPPNGVAGDIATEPSPPAFDPTLELILRDVPISSSQRVAFQTPIVAGRGAVVIANVEPGADGDGRGLYQRTVVRRGTPGGEGGWDWRSTTIDDRTIFDTWHGPPGLGLDRDGFLHVGFNMHNFPWQYAVSNAPDSIDGFRFLGEPITDAEFDRHVFENRTGFESQGTAAIPGTQITYPAFHTTDDGELYVAYRRAARPAREFTERTMSGAVARYEAGADAWRALGGVYTLDPGDVENPDGRQPRNPRLLAGRTGWTVYTPSLEVDPAGRLHTMLFWREGTAGADLGRPCVVVRHGEGDYRRTDGTPLSLPVRPEACDGDMGIMPNERFASVTDTAINARGELHAVLSPAGSQDRWLVRWTGIGWERSVLPDAAGVIFFDAEDMLWAVADGPTLFRRGAGGAFELVLDRPTDGATTNRGCLPHAALDDARRAAYVLTRGCNSDVADVYRARLLD